MLNSFDFQAPRYTTFSKISHLKDPNDYQINLTDANDYWFMISHVQRSPLNHPQNQDQSGQSNKEMSRPNVIKRVKISQVFKNQVINQQEINKQKHDGINEVNTQKAQISVKQHKQENIFKNANKPAKLTHKSNKITIINQKQKLLPKQRLQVKKNLHQSRFTVGAIVPSTTIMTRNKSMSKRAPSKDSYPCPFAPRYQRQWEKKAKKRYSSLSPGARTEAEKQMGQIKKEKNKIPEQKVAQPLQKNKKLRKN